MKYAAMLVALALAACGDDGTVVADANTVDVAIPDGMPREVITSTQPLVPGEIIEGILTGGPGDIAVIKLSAPLADIGWNLHGHANGGTQIIFEEHDKQMVEYTFAPASRADWYLLIRNEGSANLEVSVRVEIFGDFTWAWQ